MEWSIVCPAVDSCRWHLDNFTYKEWNVNSYIAFVSCSEVQRLKAEFDKCQIFTRKASLSIKTFFQEGSALGCLAYAINYVWFCRGTTHIPGGSRLNWM